MLGFIRKVGQAIGDAMAAVAQTPEYWFEQGRVHASANTPPMPLPGLDAELVAAYHRGYQAGIKEKQK